MAVDEAKVLRQLNLENLGQTGEKVYIDALSVAGDELSEKFKDYINSNSKGSGALGQSVASIPIGKGFEIQADFYYDFVDGGVKGMPGKRIDRKVTQGAYQFKSLKTSREMFDNIRSLVPGDDGIVWVAMINIKKRGIQAKNITDNVVTDDVLEKIASDLQDITGIIVTATVTKHSKEAR